MPGTSQEEQTYCVCLNGHTWTMMTTWLAFQIADLCQCPVCQSKPMVVTKFASCNRSTTGHYANQELLKEAAAKHTAAT